MSIEIGKNCNGCEYKYPLWKCLCKHQMNFNKDRCHWCGYKPPDIMKLVLLEEPPIGVLRSIK